MFNCKEISGVKRLVFYENKGVVFHYPDISNKNEIDGLLVATEINERPAWSRGVNYSGNYTQVFKDIFNFYSHGINDNNRRVLDKLRLNRNGFIVEAQMVSGDVYVFRAPVFVSKAYGKEKNLRTWGIELSYRVPAFKDYILKLNNNVILQGALLYSDKQTNFIKYNNTKPILYS